MAKKLLILFVVLTSVQTWAGNKIKYYFNQPVDTSISTGVNAQYLKNCSADTLIAYINRSKYTLDVCLYDFDTDTVVTRHYANDVADAINAAYARGVKVRWIYETSCGNTGLSLLNSAINTLGSPQGYPQYTIMHNKFMIVDAKSTNPDDPIVWTGCENWYTEQFNWDFNNIVIVQDSAFARAYLAEFNMMWGDTGIAPNAAVAKFGQYKTDLGLHDFWIEGKHIELYFSPSDGTNGHIESAIQSANTDLYVGMYTFTEVPNANMIIARQTAGVYVAEIDDSWSNSNAPYSILAPGLGSNFKVYTETDTSLYHNKFLIADPSDTCSDPLVLTGSHNWSVSANSKNDENTIIIHNDTAANLFLQYFKATFNSLGGTLTPVSGCVFPAGINSTYSVQNETNIFPNPNRGNFSVRIKLPAEQAVSIIVTDLLGRTVATLLNNTVFEEGVHVVQGTINTSGTYMVHFTVGNETYTRRLVVL
jgi:PLD-like domain/Secretion system C-terminal sorting domain